MNTNLKIIKFLETNNVKYIKSSNKELSFFCPFHHNTVTPAASINLKNGLWHCFSCNAKGNYAKLQESLSSEIIDEFEPSLTDELEFLNNRNRKSKSIKLLNEYHDLYHSYFEERGISLHTARERLLRYDYNSDRIVLPIWYEDGSLAGAQGRSVTNAKPKYNFLIRCQKSEVLYGLERVKKFDKCIVVEGIISAILLGQLGIRNVVSTLGVGYSDFHIDMLNSFDKVYILFDKLKKNKNGKYITDKAGIEASINLANDLETRAFIPTVKYKDVDNLVNKKVLLKVLNSSKVYDNG